MKRTSHGWAGVVPAAILSIAPLPAADMKVDLSKDRSASRRRRSSRWSARGWSRRTAPTKSIMVDGRPWVASKDNPTKLLIESARKLYGTSNEELMDNAKQFAYYPVAVLKGVDTFSNGTISVKFKTVAGDADRCSGHPLQRQAERRLAGHPLQRHREQRRAVGVPQRHPPSADQSQRPREAVHARPRDSGTS